jgi:hypothetical protein
VAHDAGDVTLAQIHALVRSQNRGDGIADLRRIVRRGDPHVTTLHAVYALVNLEAAEARDDLEWLGAHLGGSAGAIARAAAFLVVDRVDALAKTIAEDSVLAHASPQAYLHVPRVPAAAPVLFAAWVATLRRESPRLGVTALRAFLGDVAEAVFRSLQHGARAEELVGESDRGFLVDALCAELGGTTDFIAARGMTWLLGAVAAGDETVRAAIERARERFRDAEFQADCEAILTGAPWPPKPHG